MPGAARGQRSANESLSPPNFLHRRGQRASLLAAAFFCLPPSLIAQTSASLGVGASIVEYDGFLTSGAAAITPAIQFDAAKFSIGAQGNWTIFETGNQVVQATGAFGWLAPLRRNWRLELASTLGFSKYAEEVAVGHLLGRGRVHLYLGDYGAWMGATAGAVADNSGGAIPLEVAFGAWTAKKQVTLIGVVTAAWLNENRYLDIGGAAQWRAKRVELEARVGARPWTVSQQNVGDALTGVWGEISALVPLTKQISLSVSGGAYPSDPVRRVLGANYVTAGFRIATAGADALPVLVDPEPIIAAARGRNAAITSTEARLEIVSNGALQTIRVHAANAKTVELMGDFTDWQPISLDNYSDGVWQLQRELTPGVHRVNVRIDGGEWIVPQGARQEQDEFGGVVGIIVIR